MNLQRIQQLRREAENEAKQILNSKTKINGKNLDSKNNITIKRESSLHSLLPQEDIDYCINNNLDIGYLYTEMASKYNGNVVKEKKQYYIPNGKPRGRPKKDNNEQEQ